MNIVYADTVKGNIVGMVGILVIIQQLEHAQKN